jgi:thiol-disulfide isomerase/thioredoxin
MSGVFFWSSYAFLWVLTLLGVGATMLLYRAEGRRILTRRGAGRGLQGPELGQHAPPLVVADLSGVLVGLTGRDLAGSVLFFGSPNCGPCRQVLPAVEAFAKRNIGTVDVIAVCRSGPLATRDFTSPAPSLAHTIADSSGRVFGAYKVFVTPFVVLIDGSGAVVEHSVVSTDPAFFDQLAPQFRSARSDSMTPDTETRGSRSPTLQLN